jgi:hypothetical protein
MIRLIAKWYAKLSYVFSLEIEGGKSDINAAIAKQNAEETRRIAAQLTAEADELEKNIKDVEAEEEARKSAPEYLKLTPPREVRGRAGIEERKGRRAPDACRKTEARRGAIEEDTRHRTERPVPQGDGAQLTRFCRQDSETVTIQSHDGRRIDRTVKSSRPEPEY